MQAKEFQSAWLADPEVFSVNELPPCSDHHIWASPAEAERGEGTCLVQSLDGTWRAHFAMTPREAPDALLTDGSLDSTLPEITVPGEFQLQNPDWDPPHYVNFQYPWDGHEALVPPQVSDTYNPTVTCIRNFFVDAERLTRAGRCVLSFAAAEAALAVWVNGTFVGYAEDSFTPHRFDVTDCLRAGENRLAARVFKRCSGSWLEDQDFWRFSGIHRGVTLTFEPKIHLSDLFVHTPLSDGGASARLEAEMQIERPAGTVEVTLTDDAGETVFSRTVKSEAEIHFAEEVHHPRLWTAETPDLYRLTMTLRDESGEVCEVAQTAVGFRSFKMVDRVMCLNGKRIVFHGVNRHEFDPDLGRVMTEELLRRDLEDMKRMNVNAIRTCHYPNCSRFYELCDEYGFYVIDETNIETHGTWQRPDPDERAVPASRPEWKEAILARGRAMLERDKNHPCVLLWSCGNESYFGDDLLVLSNYFRERNPGRLVHYEGCWPSERYSGTTDVYSRMYFKVAEIEAYLSGDPQKPFVSCEFSHAMGNSNGGLSLYTALEDRYPMYQGGFIWDYVDQALRVTLPDGTVRLAYGGDFGDRPTDWHFNTNGIILGDRTWTPKAQEVRQCYADIRLKPDGTGVTVENRKVFAALKGFKLMRRVWINRAVVREETVDMPEIGPEQSAHITLPADGMSFDAGETVIHAEAIDPEGRTCAFGETVFGGIPETRTADLVPMTEGDHNLGVRMLGIMMNRAEGLISMRDADGKETLLCPPMLSMFRAPTDNDRGNRDALREGIWHAVSRYSGMSNAELSDGGVTWRFDNRLLPEMDLRLTMTPREDGLHVRLTWKGIPGQPDLPCFGLALPMDARLKYVRYWGLGPDENYVDRCSGAWLGWHTFRADEALTRYAHPQECGSRRAVNCLRLTDDRGHGVEITGKDLEISVLPWLPEEIAAARHPDELSNPRRTVLDIAAFRKGIGGDDSWGAPVLPQFTYSSDRDYTLDFTIRGI
ncbi:MAG: beta-galactosidase [Clostridia bacterium]|nr:beta-galactosidase [Clostridia bacterium]